MLAIIMLELTSSPRKLLLIILISTICGANYANGAYISTGVVKAVCKSWSSYKATNKLVSQIGREVADQSYPSEWIRWTKCDTTGKQCSRFVSKANSQNDPNHGPSGILKADSIPESEFERKSEQNCSEDEIPHRSTSPGQKLSSHSVDITSRMISLQQHAQHTHKDVMELLKNQYCTDSKTHDTCDSIEELWLTNEIVVSGANLEEVKRTVDGNPDVQSVREELTFTLDEPDALGSPRQAQDYDDIVCVNAMCPKSSLSLVAICPKST